MDTGATGGVTEEETQSRGGDLGRVLASMNPTGHGHIGGGGDASFDDYAAWGIANPFNNKDITGPITAVTGGTGRALFAPFFVLLHRCLRILTSMVFGI